ncbi:hypothetical protein EF513_04540 [Rickettsiales endosymbiont of Stachyamoeba lipophora]|nr:hypothetical protein EF513_04540 [Rickettsiales endosymbiont of Stachyamoeba lipophora]
MLEFLFSSQATYTSIQKENCNISTTAYFTLHCIDASKVLPLLDQFNISYLIKNAPNSSYSYLAVPNINLYDVNLNIQALYEYMHTTTI